MEKSIGIEITNQVAKVAFLEDNCAPMALEVETFAKVSGREVSFVLLSPGAAEQVEFIRNQAIDNELIAIRELAPEIAIIEV